jgi:hypothetical protein
VEEGEDEDEDGCWDPEASSRITGSPYWQPAPTEVQRQSTKRGGGALPGDADNISFFSSIFT